jgi:hypothetical protein
MAEYGAMLERHKLALQQQEFPVAQLCAMTANLNRNTKKRRVPYEPSEFMLHPFDEQKRMTKEDIYRADPLRDIRRFDDYVAMTGRGKKNG